MNRAFSRTIDLTPAPAFRGVGAYDSGEVKIAQSTLYKGGVIAATGGILLGAAIVGILKPAFVGTAAATLGPLALIPGAAVIGIGYYTLWTGGDKLAV